MSLIEVKIMLDDFSSEFGSIPWYFVKTPECMIQVERRWTNGTQTIVTYQRVWMWFQPTYYTEYDTDTVVSPAIRNISPAIQNVSPAIQNVSSTIHNGSPATQICIVCDTDMFRLRYIRCIAYNTTCFACETCNVSPAIQNVSPLTHL